MARDLTSAKVDRREAIKVGFSRCSSSPVNVRMKMLPRFSKVHMVFSGADELVLLQSLEIKINNMLASICETSMDIYIYIFLNIFWT